MIEMPKVDGRSRQDIVAELRALIPLYAPAWNRGPGKPWPAGDPGAALVEIFARFCEIVIERLNRAPDKNFLAFLDMIGVSLLPPMPARAPVRFYLAVGAVADAAVPRGLPLATSGPAPQNFETERSLVVTPAQLMSAMTLDPRSDTYTEHGAGQGALVPFAGANLIGHVLYLGHDTVLKVARPTTVGVMFDLGALTASQLPFLTSLLTTLSWWIRKAGQPLRVSGTAVLTTPLRGTAYSSPAAATRLTGVGTAFTRDLAVGDLIAVPGVGVRKVTVITNDTTLTVDLSVTVPGPPGVTIGRVVGRSMTGTMHTGGVSSMTLTGGGTRFTTELTAGDRLALPGVGTRTVTAIASDTALTVDAAVSIPGPPGIAAAEVIAPRPVQGTAHTAGVSTASLTGVGTLFTGDLQPGDTIAIPDVGTRRVTAIASDIALTVDAPATLAGPPGVTLSRVVPLRLEVSFASVAGIEPWTVGGVAAYWLWARSEFPLAVAATLPTVRAAAVRSAIETPVAPDRAFANSAPVDLAKGGFFPFGERPKINDTLYLGSDEVFSKTNARVTLTVTLSFPINESTGNTGVTITWEFWNHGVWTPFGTVVHAPGGTSITTAGAQLTDETSGFTVAGTHTLTFLCPEIPASEVSGQKSTWIRARIAANGYGADARLAPATGVTTPRTLADWVYTPASFRPPFISDVSLSYAYEEFQDVETVVRENAFAIDAVGTARDGRLLPFTPFVPPPDEAPALYLGFDRAFSNSTFTLYLAVGEQVTPPTSPLVTWEYWNGVQWRSLGVFDETKNLTQPGLVESIGPSDFGRQVKFGRDLHWLRARLQRGQKERFTIAGIHPNTVWAVQAVTLRGEVLGSGAGKPGQTFTLSRSPVLRGQAIEVREPEPPSPEEVAALEAEGETGAVLIVRDEVRKTTEVWVRWHEVDNFHVSEPSSRHYVVERATGRVQFGDGVRGLIPPPGRDNVRAAQYQAGGGRKGNVAAGTITVMKRAVSSIDRVENPFPASGGADQESLEDVKVRGPLQIKHQGRAVAYEDFQWLAQEASIQVALVRCLPASDAATAGSITLLIVPESDDPKPSPAPGLIRQVQEYLDARRTPTADLAIIGPGYVEVSVTTEVVPVSFDEADLVRRRIVENLTAFLHPLKGGIDRRGWAFGRDVFLSEVTAVIEATAGVDHVRRLTLSGQAEAGDRTRDGGRRVEIRGVPGELPASGTHTVTMSAS